MNVTTRLKPGYPVDLVINVDLAKETIDVRRSIVYDIVREEYIVSQTTPFIRDNNLGQQIYVTYLLRQQEKYIRFGFHGLLSEILRDYRLHSEQVVPAIVIMRNSAESNYDLRMYYRVRPGSDWTIKMKVGSESINLLNISLGGALFTCPRDHALEVASMIKISFEDDEGMNYQVMTRVKRAWPPIDMRKTKLNYVAVQFMDRNPDFSRRLNREIIQVQRGALYKT